MSLHCHHDRGTPHARPPSASLVHRRGSRHGSGWDFVVNHAAAEAGIDIPKLCATEQLESFGSCRLCVVQVKDRRGYPASCTTLVEEGMEVTTENDALFRLRRGVMELYISDHPLDCLTCSANGNCELQDMAGRVGLREVRYAEGDNHLAETRIPRIPISPTIPPSASSCSRCVRACSDIRHVRADHHRARLRVAYRGGGRDDFLSSECVSCGASVAALPDGGRCVRSRYRAGQPQRSITTTCAIARGLLVNAEMQGEKVIRMVPDNQMAAPITATLASRAVLPGAMPRTPTASPPR